MIPNEGLRGSFAFNWRPQQPIPGLQAGDGISIVDNRISVSGVQDIAAGTNITIDRTNPHVPIISSSGGGGGGTVESVVAGTGITVDNTDPANPVVSATGSGTNTWVIPFASKSPCDLYTTPAGVSQYLTIVGFGGASVPGMIPFTTPGSNTFDLGSPDPTDSSLWNNCAFLVPEDCTITTVAGFVNTACNPNPVNFTGDGTIYAQLYVSTTPNTAFTAIPGTQLTFGTYTSTLASGELSTDRLTGLSIPVTAMSRIALGVYGSGFANNIGEYPQCFFSGGVTFSS